MNLKEAFRYQNYLRGLMEDVQSCLEDTDNVTRTVETTYRSKADPGAKDETTEVRRSDFAWTDKIDKLVDFLLWLLGQREKLAKAIRRAKAALAFDIDGEVSLNGARQQAAATLRRMAGLKASEYLVPGGGKGYRFNAEGNQVAYVCDVRRVTTIHFDRNAVRAACTELSRRADAVSTEIDRTLVNGNVDYETPIDVGSDFNEAFETWLSLK